MGLGVQPDRSQISARAKRKGKLLHPRKGGGGFIPHGDGGGFTGLGAFAQFFLPYDDFAREPAQGRTDLWGAGGTDWQVAGWRWTQRAPAYRAGALLRPRGWLTSGAALKTTLSPQGCRLRTAPGYDSGQSTPLVRVFSPDLTARASIKPTPLRQSRPLESSPSRSKLWPTDHIDRGRKPWTGPRRIGAYGAPIDRMKSLAMRAFASLSPPAVVPRPSREMGRP